MHVKERKSNEQIRNITFITLSCAYFCWLTSYETQEVCLSLTLSPRLLFSSIRIAPTLHGTKSNSVLLLNELAGEAARLDCIGGMLIYHECRSGDAVIKDSISQRSGWCDHILLLTDAVSLTSALWRRCSHKRHHQHLLTRNRESGVCQLKFPHQSPEFFQQLCSAIKLLMVEGEAYSSSPLQTAKARILPPSIIFT